MSSPRPHPPRPSVRLALSLLVGAIAAFRSYLLAIGPGTRDFVQIWYAARAVLAGHDPYALIGPGRAFDYPFRLVYPLPAALVAMPLAPLRAPIACAVFFFIGATLFAWALMEHGKGPLLGVLGAALFFAAEESQWSPLFAASMIIAPISFVLVAKPTIGAAMFVARPSWWAAWGAIVLLGVSFVVQPDWLDGWRDGVSHGSVYPAPVLIPGGVLALLSLTRWRRPEARLIAALACVPQTLLLYEAVPLFLVPRGWKQSLLLVALSWGVLWWYGQHDFHNDVGLAIATSARAIVPAMYLPATIMVLLRPNEGPVPAWLERAVVRWPTWLRGRQLTA